MCLLQQRYHLTKQLLWMANSLIAVCILLLVFKICSKPVKRQGDREVLTILLAYLVFSCCVICLAFLGPHFVNFENAVKIVLPNSSPTGFVYTLMAITLYTVGMGCSSYCQIKMTFSYLTAYFKVSHTVINKRPESEFSPPSLITKTRRGFYAVVGVI
jgi:hypothetical protein